MKKLKRISALFLCALMICLSPMNSLIPVYKANVSSVLAAAEDDNSLVLNKKVDKTANGYEITLEAYATGEEVEQPVDVVFVVDQSTSMYTIADTVSQVEDGTTISSYITSSGYTYSKFQTFASRNTDLVAQEGYFLVRINDAAENFAGEKNDKGEPVHSKYYATKEDYDGVSSHTGNMFHVIGKGGTKLDGTITSYNQKKYTNDTDDFIWLAVRWKNNRLEYNVTVLDSFDNKNNGGVSGTEYYTGDKYWLPFPACADDLNTTNIRFYKTIYGATFDAMMLFYNNTKNLDNVQVAIAGFSEGGGIFGATTTNGYKEDIDLKKHTLTQAQATDLTSFLKNIKSNYGNNAFAQAGSTTLLNRIKKINPNYYGTVTDAGLALANYIFKNGNITGARADAKRYVILYTDGNPVGNLIQKYDGDTTSYSNEAIRQANIAKTKYGAEVYSIAPARSVNKKYLNYVSSAYPNATSLSSSGEANPDGKTYSYAATDTAHLTEVFKTLSEMLSQTSITLGKNTILRDTINASFMMPENSDVDDIKVYTADYNGSSFGALKTFDAQVSISGKTIDVKNFDYAGNYISEIARDGFYGRKIVVKVPIIPNPDFLGGDNVPTNKDESGIYSGNEVVEYFNRPKVNINVSTIVPTSAEKDIYLSQNVSIPDVVELGKFTQNGKQWSVDGINNAFVDIKYTIKDAQGNETVYTIPAGTKYSGLSSISWAGSVDKLPVLKEDATYTVRCEVISINNNTNKSEGNGTPKVRVFKPEITFNDSEINLGETADYKNNGGSVVWKHGNETANTATMGAAPVLDYSYSPVAGAFKKDTPVAVTVTAKKDNNKVPADMDVTTYTTFYREACTFNGCENKEKTLVSSTAADRVNFVVHLKTFDLTITKNGAKPIDENQSFMFRVTGPDNFSMDVMIVGNGSVTIKSLMTGAYSVTELTDWSWRYTPDKVTQQVDLASTEDGVVRLTFNNTRDEKYWLSGDSFIENWWGKFVTTGR